MLQSRPGSPLQKHPPPGGRETEKDGERRDEDPRAAREGRGEGACEERGGLRLGVPPLKKHPPQFLYGYLLVPGRLETCLGESSLCLRAMALTGAPVQRDAGGVGADSKSPLRSPPSLSPFALSPGYAGLPPSPLPYRKASAPCRLGGKGRLRASLWRSMGLKARSTFPCHTCVGTPLLPPFPSRLRR